MVKEEITDFLRKVPPFDLLNQELLEFTSENISIAFYPRGIKILSQNGPPCTSLRIVKKGGVKVYVTTNEGEEVIIDYRSEGDSFGFVSLISGDKSRANVIALEDTICYLIPKEIVVKIMDEEPLVREYFMKSFFVNFIDKTYSEMRNRSVLFGNGDKLLYTTPVKELINKEAVTAPAGISVKEAASIMSQFKISSLVLLDSSKVPVGIITDRDLRDKVVARGMDLSIPVDEIMSPALIRVDAHEVCSEALIKMIKYGIHHLLVVEGGKLKGVVTNHDFMMLQGTSPLSIVKNIDRQKSMEGLIPMSERINRIVSILFKEGVKARQIVRIITELNDRLLKKIIEQSIKQIGPVPSPLTVIVYGSEGRKEQTFKTVFDWAILYEDQKTSLHEKVLQDYCKKLIEHLEIILKKSGFPTFDSHPFGRDKSICGSIVHWEKVVTDSLMFSDDSRAYQASKFLDLRSVFGSESLASHLKEKLYWKIRNNQEYMSRLFQLATKQRSPLGFFKTFVVERGGEHKDELNLREKGIIPIVNSLRAVAIENGIEETSTMDRLDIISGKKTAFSEISTDISSAFEFLLHLRMQDQLKKKEFHEEIDDFIDPKKLSMLEKKTLKEAFQIITKLQDIVAHHHTNTEVQT